MPSIKPITSPVNPWSDTMGTSLRADGAKVGEFLNGDHYSWWSYPPGWKHRGTVDALGPFNSRQEAKVALSSWLGVTV